MSLDHMPDKATHLKVDVFNHKGDFLHSWTACGMSPCEC